MSYAYTNFQFLRTSSYVIVLPERTGHIDDVVRNGSFIIAATRVPYSNSSTCVITVVHTVSGAVHVCTFNRTVCYRYSQSATAQLVSSL